MDESISSLRKKYSEIDKVLVGNEVKILELEKSLESKNKLYSLLEDKINLLEQENKTLRKKMISTFSPEDLSKYFNRIIEQFNADSQSDTDMVHYMMSSVDVDLKAHIYADEQGNMKCSSPIPSAEGEMSLSTIKFSIRAIQKQNE